MSQLLEAVVFSLSIISFLTVAYLYISLRVRHNNLVVHYVNVEMEKELFKQKLTEEISRRDSKKLEQTEGFVRFISQSRDAAYDYIENVQKDIAELKDYFDKNGLNFTVEQADEMAKRIENVINHLPEETKND